MYLISWQISSVLKEMYLGIIYTFTFLGDAALIVPTLIWSKDICLLCAVTATFLDRFLSNVVWRCVLSLVFGDAATCVPSVMGSKVIFWWMPFVGFNCHISWQILSNFLHRCITLIYTHTVLLMLLLVLTIVWATTGDLYVDLYVILLFQGGERGSLSFLIKLKDDTKLLSLLGDTFILHWNTDCNISSNCYLY